MGATAAARALVRTITSPHFDLPAEQLDALAGLLRPVSLQPGEAFQELGEPARSALLFEDGLMRAYYLHDDREVNLRLLWGPSVALDFAAAIKGELAGEWVEAITTIDGFRLDLDAFRRLPLYDPMQRVLAEQHYLALDQRLRTLQWKSVAQRYAYFREHADPEVLRRASNYHIASYLGVAPETLSRAKRALR